MSKRKIIKKLDEDDILEILIEHFQKGKFGESCGQGCILGTPGKDLRFIGVISKNCGEYNLEEIDKEMDFNGDHAFLKKHPEFYIQPPTNGKKETDH